MFWHWSYSTPWWGWWFPFHGLMSLIFTIVIIVLFVSLIRRRHPPYNYPYSDTSRSQAALQILEERYAKGEIQREEYLQKKQDLRS